MSRRAMQGNGTASGPAREPHQGARRDAPGRRVGPEIERTSPPLAGRVRAESVRVRAASSRRRRDGVRFEPKEILCHDCVLLLEVEFRVSRRWECRRPKRSRR